MSSDTNATQVTVVIPARNEETRIHASLNALKKQTYPAFDVLVVDNNSTDATAKIAQQYGARVVHEETAGYAYAYNKGLQSAQSEIIAVTDADSEPDPYWISEIIRTFEDKKVVAVTGSILLPDQPKVLAHLLKLGYSFFIRFNFLIGKPHVTGFNMAFRKIALENVQYMNTAFSMSPEVDIGLRLSRIGKIRFQPRMKVATSTRRWEKNIIATLIHYARGYIFAVWLRKPPYSVKKIDV